MAENPRLIEAFDPEHAAICEAALRRAAIDLPLPIGAELGTLRFRLRLSADLLFHAQSIHQRTTGLSLAINVNNLPEVLVGLRQEMANILRDAAAGEDPRTVAKLNQLAAAFEVGQSA